MLSEEEIIQAQVSAFEKMISQGNKEHVEKASKIYNFDFFNDKSTNESEISDNREPYSPFIWTEEESATDYFKRKRVLEIKPRMSVSLSLGRNDVPKNSQGENKRFSETNGNARASIFSLTTSASTNLDKSFDS